ncbi:MAG: hypothetical protein EZS28_039106 [Streblomastix strix]|uniref:Uncharacterized protein n=1 Tax=Streblomastix strix TaxID=222440 RepID=A0A5J4U4T5_9EUKA|nr:MAG: hypothetical protein EZS28_039106 [Streblomastix strix]
MLNKNENLTLQQNQETQITRIRNDLPPTSSRLLGQSPKGQGPIELYIPRNIVIPQATIFPHTLNAKQEILEISNVITKETIENHMQRQILQVFDLIPVCKDDEGQYQPGFGPGVSYATDWRKSNLQALTPTVGEDGAFWKDCNFDLRVACVRKEYDSKDNSETLQPAKTIKHEFRNRFGRYRIRS